MEADWEVEIGSGAPVIEALWPGYVDLRSAPERISEISEATAFPALASALLLLNTPTALAPSDNPSEPGSATLMWTAKCDRWDLDSCDPDELEAEPAYCAVGSACYLDLLPRKGLVFKNLAQAEQWARLIVTRLHQATCPACRVDLVIREAVAGSLAGFGVTAYLTACAPTPVAAEENLGKAIEVFSALLEQNQS